MQSYWDLTEKERATLSEQGVEAFVNFELMQKGVLPPREPELVDVPAVAPKQETYFAAKYKQPRYHWDETTSVAFLTKQAFLNACPDMVRIEEDSATGFAVAHPIATRSATVDAVDFGEHERLRATLEHRKSSEDSNKRETERYKKECEARAEALRGMWDDWHECRERKAQMERIRDTMAEYLKLASDVDTASAFLRKVFDETVIVEAVEWCEFRYTHSKTPRIDDPPTD